MTKGTILVIDDEKELADLVRRSLEQEGFDVILAMDGTSGLKIATAHRPDLVVLDLSMPDIDGLEVCQRLKGDPRHVRIPILVLSARASAADRILGLELGADDYLVKPFVPRELVARVKALLRRPGDRTATTAAVRMGDLIVDLHAHHATLRGKPLPLTAAEFRILAFLALHPGRAFSRDEIIEAALQSDAAVTERTVDAHMVGIRKALGDAAEYVQTVRSVGYRMLTADEIESQTRPGE
ncbi:MAG: response regulator with CheY-like receiver domain and winged-helix DNA-binding domain [Phycisphaerales bacterium]|nr:response regulator with CheY-like receiver domain and winged-helix DNA-binding domain [Phycisphaerales bacterium]MDB5358513.1 response regulator with CheY-like receiver domain and winged-helix DNA-binding domain [Phycisphaerales bacterium]